MDSKIAKVCAHMRVACGCGHHPMSSNILRQGGGGISSDPLTQKAKKQGGPLQNLTKSKNFKLEIPFFVKNFRRWQGGPPHQEPHTLPPCPPFIYGQGGRLVNRKVTRLTTFFWPSKIEFVKIEKFIKNPLVFCCKFFITFAEI